MNCGSGKDAAPGGHTPLRDISRAVLVFMALTCAACVHSGGWSGGGVTLEFIGEATFPTGFQYKGYEVGGLSGIDYDPVTDRYIVISDDRAQYGPVRFFDLQVDLSDGVLDPGDVVFAGVTQILDKDGDLFKPLSVDPEAIRFSPLPDRIVWTSEGDTDVAPFVRVMTRDGIHIDEFIPPVKYWPTATAGTRRNMTFESLTFGHDPRSLLTATENALRQDGPHASLSEGSPVRVLVLDAGNGEPQAEYVYRTEAVATAPEPADGFATNGLVELLTFDNERFMALERSYSTGVGNTVRLFLTATKHATDVRAMDSIAQRKIRFMPKELLFDLDELDLALDNIEGMTFGKSLADGSRTLILVSDNNFNKKGGQFTQFLAFRLSLDD